MKRILLVGFGTMGRLHFGCLEELAREGAEARWAGIAEPRLSEAGAKLLDGRDVPLFPSVEEALRNGPYDGAVVAAPTEAHFAAASALLEAGIPVLLEKTLCGDVGAARSLFRAARERGLFVLPGFTERSHRALALLAEWTKGAGPLRSAKLRRLTPFRYRYHSVDPVDDLLVHDLEHVAWLVPGDWTVVSTGRVRDGAGVDEASARLRLGGAEADLLVGWSDAAESERTLEAVCERGRFFLNWFDGTWEADGRKGSVPNDPLGMQARLFLEAIDGKRADELRDREASALRAMEALDACRASFAV